MAEGMNYSLSDLAAITKGTDGMFGGNSWGILILLFLFWGFLGRGGLWGSPQEAMGKLSVDGASASQVESLSNKVSQDAILGAISGNKDAINGIAQALNCSTNTVVSAIQSASNMSTQNFNQLSSSVASCCCTIRQEMAAGFGSLNNNLLQATNGINTNILTSVNSLDKTLCGLGNSINSSIAGLQNTTVSAAAQLGYQASTNTNTIVQAIEASTNRTLDWLNQNKINELQTSLATTKSALDNTNQTNTILQAINAKTCGCSCSNSCNGCC